jgi:ferritin-like protein
MSNCAIEGGVFDEAMDALMNIGQVEEVDHDDLTDESTYKLADDKPRMMKVFSGVEARRRAENPSSNDNTP